MKLGHTASGGDPAGATYPGAIAATVTGGGQPGDVDGDGDVDVTDLGLLLPAFGTCTGDPGFNPQADLNDDGCVGVTDLGLVLGNFGA